jgi:excisionase family DNA binding protein
MPDQALSNYRSPSQLLRVREVAAMLAVSAPTVWRLVRTGELGVVHIGGSTRFLRSDVQRLIEQGRQVQVRMNGDPAGGPGLVKTPARRGRHVRG